MLNLKKKLSKSPFKRIQSKKIRLILEFIVVLVIALLSYIALLRIDTEQANNAINENMVAYFNALNQKDFSTMRKQLYPTDNEEYLLDILMKSEAVGVTSVRLQKIYPALVDGNIAIAGFETSTNAIYKGEDITTRQTNTFFFRKKAGVWYIAKPQDLVDIPAQKISDMIDSYQPVMKINMAENIAEQQAYNQASFDKITRKAGK